jgi:hypothetical protein
MKTLMSKVLIFFILIFGSQFIQAAKITLVPEGKLHLNVTNPDKGYSDLVLHSVLISTAQEELFTVSEVRIDLMSKERVVLSKSLPMERIVGETQGVAQMAAQGLGAFLNAQILTRNGFRELFGRELQAASSSELKPNEVLMLTRQHFSLDFVPDQLRVTIHGINALDEEEVLHVSTAVESYNSPVSYTTPLRGAWLMTSLPSIQSHHRLNPPTEFAVDFFRPDGEGKIYTGDPQEASAFFGFGAEVLAAAAGEVVFIIDDEVQDRAAYLPREGETPRQTSDRVSFYNMKRYAEDFQRAAAGNLITIRHQVDGVSEYSSYGHLKSGSVRVAVGDLVERGQAIAEVGDTGDSAAVHLHFQVNNDVNVFASKSLPISFSDLEQVLGGVDPGQFVKSSL